MKEGIHKISFNEYKAIDALNNSTLGNYSKSPDTCIVPDEDTAAKSFGRAFHTLILEPELFDLEQRVVPEGKTRRTKEYKDYELTYNEHQTLKAMEDSLLSDKYNTASKMIERANKEISIVWDDKELKTKCKARIDLDIPEFGIIADLKTCQSAVFESWIRSSLTITKPHFQPYWYLRGMNQVSDVGYKTFLWILVEKKSPFRVSVVNATPENSFRSNMLEVAEIEIKKIIPQYLQSKETDSWCGLPDVIQDGSLPDWYVNKIINKEK